MPRIGRKSDGVRASAARKDQLQVRGRRAKARSPRRCPCVRRAAAPERRKRGAETVEGRKMGAHGPEKREKRALATLFRKKNDDY